MAARTGEQQVAGANKMASSISEGSKLMAPEIENGSNDSLRDAAKFGEGMAVAGAGGTAGFLQSALAPVTAMVSPIVGNQKVIQAFKDSHPLFSAAYDALSSASQSKVGQQLSEIQKKHPDAVGAVGDFVNTLLAAVGGGEVEEPFANAVKESVTADTAKSVAGDLSEIPGKVAAKAKAAVSPKASELDTITDAISPKQTAKEAKAATASGRLVKGQEPGIFTSGKPDTVLPSASTARAASTIQAQIPGAAKMTDPERYIALDNKTTEIAQGLKPKMEAKPITEGTITKINDDWTSLKKQQMESADATDEPNVRKLQQQFEAFLKKSQSGNMNDLWETRKSYDSSIPDNVKNAGPMSPESLQNKRSIWLQNRAILNDAINDEMSGLGEDSRRAFQDMNDMYNAKEGILSKAKIETGVKPSKLAQFAKSPTGKVVGSIVGSGIVYETAKGLGVPLP